MDIDIQTINPKFTELFRTTFGLNNKEFELFFANFYKKTISKKEYYLRAGQICSAKTYLNKGCMRNFVVDEKGHERILFFSFEDWWVGDFESFYSGQPGTNYVQALEDCELLVIPKDKFALMENRIPKLKQWYVTKMIPAASAARKRLEEQKILSPEERYIALLEKQPSIFQRVPLQYIAAYLNIEPQSLSRMRNRLTKKD
jgi:CRP-like cAMP-binding protein